MTKTNTITVSGTSELQGFFDSGNRLWIGSTGNDLPHSVELGGNTLKDLTLAVQKLISSAGLCGSGRVDYVATPILNELWALGGAEGDIVLLPLNTANGELF